MSHVAELIYFRIVIWIFFFFHRGKIEIKTSFPNFRKRKYNFKYDPFANTRHVIDAQFRLMFLVGAFTFSTRLVNF